MATYNVTRVPPGGAGAGRTLTSKLFSVPKPTPQRSSIITATESAVIGQTIVSVNQVTETNTAQPIIISTTINNTFDGIGDGVAITNANSGGVSGTPVDSASNSVASITNKYRGTAGAVCSVGGTASTAYVEHSASLRTFSNGSLYGRGILNLPILPATFCRVAVITDSATAFQAEWRINSTGRLEQRSGAGSLINTSTNTITAGQWFRLEVAILTFDVTNGVTECKLFLDPTSSTATETLTSAASFDTLRTSGGQNKARFGINNSTTNLTVYVDDVGWSNVDYLGPTTTAATTVVVNQVTETDTPQAITSRKIKLVGQVIEPDTPQAITRRKVKSVLQTTETSTLQTITKRKQKTVAQVTEIPTSQAITKRKFKTLLQPSEADLSQTITRRKVKGVLQVNATDSAQLVTRDVATVVGQATEIDFALPITRRKINRTVLPVESDAPQPIRPIRIKAVGQVIETDTTTLIVKRKLRTVVQTLELDSVQNIKVQGRVSQVLEIDTVQPIRVIKRKALGQPTDTNTALIVTLSRILLVTIHTVHDVGSPTAVRVIKQKTLGVGIETALARTIASLTVLPPQPEGVTITVLTGTTIANTFISYHMVNATVENVADVITENMHITVDLEVGADQITLVVPQNEVDV